MDSQVAVSDRDTESIYAMGWLNLKNGPGRRRVAIEHAWSGG